tara:strand:- start:2449 stop:2871 length:423 start_codon:yes stop_codon:yes gene_type:complete
MNKKFKILANFIKDMSSETTDIQSYLFVKENISKYHLNIDITSKALKNRMIEVSTMLKFEDKNASEKKSHFEIIYISIIKIDESVKDSKEIKKIVICDLQNEIYPKLEKIFLNLLNDSGFPDIKIEKKVDFNKLYNESNS